MKKLLFHTIILFAILLSGCNSTADGDENNPGSPAPQQEPAASITRDNLDQASVYDTELGVGIRLGMTKTEIDGILGASEKTNDSYSYSDSSLRVVYEDGHASQIWALHRRWLFKGGFSVGAPESELIQDFEYQRAHGVRFLVMSYDNNGGKVELGAAGEESIVCALIENQSVQGLFLISAAMKESEHFPIFLKNLTCSSVRDEEEGTVISIGMGKDEVEQLLGAGTEYDELILSYCDDTLRVAYSEDEIVALLQVAGSRWSIKNGISVDMSESEIPAYFDKDGGLYTALYDKDGNRITGDAAANGTVVILTTIYDKIDAIFLSETNEPADPPAEVSADSPDSPADPPG